MKTTTKKISDTRVEVTVKLESADLAKAHDAAVERLAANVKIQGFRKGKAPRSLIESQLDPSQVAQETLDIAVRTTMPAAFDAEHQAPIAVANVNVTKYVPGESAEYVVAADVLPDVKLGDYKKLKAKRASTTPSAKDIKDVVDRLRETYAETVVAQRPAEKGDEVIIDFVGKRASGEEFAGGSAKDHHLVLGSGVFIPGFEDAVIGHSAGDKFNIEVTFPKDYGEKSLAGQPATFETLLRQVNSRTFPSDDELAKKCGDFKTLDELKADISHNLEMQNEFRAKEAYRDALVAELVKASKVSAPEILIKDQLRFISDDMKRNAASHGLSLEQYLERSGLTPEKWEKEAHKIAEERVKASLVLQLVAREEKISPTEEDVNAKIAELRDLYKKSKEAMAALKKPEVRQDLYNRLTIDMTLDYLEAVNAGNAKAAPKAKTTKTAKTTKAEKPEKPAKKAPAKKPAKKAEK